MNKKSTTPANADIRRKAELKLKELKKKNKLSPSSELDTLRLLHELQVHQIELEMQNEQLLQTQAELESTLSLYAELYAFAPVGYFTLAHDGKIRRANLTGAKLLNLSLSELIQRRFELSVEQSFRSTFRDFLARVFLNENKETCEVVLEREGSAPLWVHIEAVTNQPSSERELCYAIVSDITERKKI